MIDREVAVEAEKEGLVVGPSALTAEITRTGFMVAFGDVAVCEDLSGLRIDFPGVIA